MTAKLNAELAGVKAAIPASATVLPVKTQITGDATGAVAANNLAAASKQRLTAEDTAALKVSQQLTRAQASQASTAAKLAAVEQAGADASTKVAAATRILSASKAALAQSERNLTLAIAAGNDALIADATATKAAAVATEEKAAADLVAARAAQTHAGSLGLLSRGATGASAGLLGLRVGTLNTAGPFLAGSAAAVLFAKSISAFASFEQELNTLQATTGATTEQMRQASDAARKLGEDITLPAVSAKDAVVAITELAKAGLSVQQSIAGARGVLELATAAQIDNAQATEIAANALNAFGLAGDQATRVADVLANASNAAQGSILDFGLAFQQSSAVARQVGLSLEDTGALLSILAKAGLQGSDAGTSLRVALIRLVAPTKQASDLIKELGLQIRDAQGNVRPDVFAQFGEATAKLGPEFRDAAAAAIFGQDAIRAVAIAARSGRDGLAEMEAQIRQTGTAQELAAARTKGLAGDFESLKNSASGLAVDFGKIVAPAVHAVALTFTALTTSIDEVVNAAGKIKKAFTFEIPVPFTDKHIQPVKLFNRVSLDLATFGLPEVVRGINSLRHSSDEATPSVKDLAQAGKELKDNLTGIRVDPQGLELLPAFAASIKEIMDQVQRPQVDFGQGAVGIAAQLRLQFSKVDLTGPAGETAQKYSKALISALQHQGAAGQVELKLLGQELAHGLTLGITAEQKNTVDAANQAVKDAIQAGQQQVDAAVRSAKSNLGSIASDLAGAVGQVLDSRAEAAIASLDRSPLAREIKALTAELDKTNVKEQRAQLSIQIGTATDAASRRAAVIALKEFDLKTKLDTDKTKLATEKDNITKVAAAQKKAITDNIRTFADEFAKGQKNTAQFTNDVTASIRKAIPDFDKAGKSLANGLLPVEEALQSIIDQVNALSGFTGRVSGGTTQTNVVKPLDALKDSQKRVQDALHARGQTLAQISANGNDLLQEIRDAIRRTPTAPPGNLFGAAGGALEGAGAGVARAFGRISR